MRGFNRPGDYNSRVLLLVDGHQLNDAVFDQAPIGTDSPINVDLIDRVQIVRGPSSSVQVEIETHNLKGNSVHASDVLHLFKNEPPTMFLTVGSLTTQGQGLTPRLLLDHHVGRAYLFLQNETIKI